MINFGLCVLLGYFLGIIHDLSKKCNISSEDLEDLKEKIRKNKT